MELEGKVRFDWQPLKLRERLPPEEGRICLRTLGLNLGERRLGLKADCLNSVSKAFRESTCYLSNFSFMVFSFAGCLRLNNFDG